MTDDTAPSGHEDSLDYDRPPFVMVPIALCALPAEAVRLYVALGAYANGRTGRGAFPGQARLGQRLGMHRATVNKWLGVLRDEGWLEVQERRRADGGRSTNAYRLRHTPCRPNATGPCRADDQAPVAETRQQNQNQKNQSDPPGNAVATLPGMDVKPAPPRQDAGVLVARWCEGWSHNRRGEQPLPAQVKRVASTAKALLVGVTMNGPAWQRLERVVFDAGQRGTLDLVRAVTDANAVGSGSTGPALQGTLERAMERARAAEEAGR